MAQKILLVEDDDLIRELYAKELQDAGFEVNHYATGKESIDSLGVNHYDLALLDIMLPDTNGLEILRSIKANPKTNYLPVLLLTNLGQDEVVREGFALGAEGYLMKVSYTPDQIIEEVKKVLDPNYSHKVNMQPNAS